MEKQHGRVLTRYVSAPGRWEIRPEIRALLLWVGALVPLTVLVLLLTSGFLVHWEGTAASVRPAATEDATTRTVLIVDGDHYHEREWPTLLVDQLDLPVNPSGIPPLELADTLPTTKKSRFQLQFHVTPAGGQTFSHPTTSPRSAGVAFLFFLAGIFIRNMVYSGSPLSLEPRGVTLPKALAPHGSAAPTGRGKPRGGRKGPPPGKRRRGKGRR